MIGFGAIVSSSPRADWFVKDQSVDKYDINIKGERVERDETIQVRIALFARLETGREYTTFRASHVGYGGLLG